jgi:hypothetical protein
MTATTTARRWAMQQRLRQVLEHGARPLPASLRVDTSAVDRLLAALPIFTDAELARLIKSIRGRLDERKTQRLLDWAIDVRVASAVVELLLAGGHEAIVPASEAEAIRFRRVPGKRSRR